ncbi:MAG: hypothetical protein ACK4PI_09590 [Tepidisphaerales bacterium]
MEQGTRRVLVAWWLVGAAAAGSLGACAARDGGGASAGGGQAAEEVRPVSPLLAELPPAARLAIERQTVGATLKRVDKDEFLGRDVYTAEFVTADGRPGEVQVTRDGRVLSRSVELKEIAFAEAPEAVKATTLARTGGLTPRRVRVDDRMSRMVYVVSLGVAGRPTVFEIDETGAVLRETIDIERTQLPPAVEASIWRRFAQMPVNRVREVHEGASVTFVVDGTFERRRVRAEFEPTGRVRAVRAR